MRRFPIVPGALFAAPPSAAQDTEAFHSTDAGYTVQLPTGWRPMGHADMEMMRQASAAVGVPFTIEAGYRVTNSPTGWPFIMVGWMDLGEEVTPERLGTEMTAMHEREQSRQRAESAPAPGEVRPDALAWDAENRILWSRATIPASTRGEGAFTSTASTLHPAGTRAIVLVYYAVPGEDEDRIRADLLQIVRFLRAD